MTQNISLNYSYHPSSPTQICFDFYTNKFLKFTNYFLEYHKANISNDPVS